MAASTLTIDPAGSNDALDFVASRDSVLFNTLAIEYVDPGVANGVLGITIKRGAKDGVSGQVISVSLATDGSAVITSTAALIAAAFNGVKAACLLTSDNTAPGDGDSVTIGGQTYVFKTSLTASTTKNQVLINTTADAALLNLSRAINGLGTPGTDYGSLTLPNGLVKASTSVTNHTILITARQAGTQYNGVVTKTSMLVSSSVTTFAGAHLNGTTAGVDPLNRIAYNLVGPGGSAGVAVANTAANNGTGIVTAMAAAYFAGSTHQPTTGYLTVAAANAEGWVFSGAVTSGAIVNPTPQNLHYGAAETSYEAKLKGLVSGGGGEHRQRATSAATLLIACELSVAQLARKGRLFDWACDPFLEPSAVQV